jgi:ornithine cyclodeaminase/alanine dehydrogenase-like protein (mu-crystallin family)
VRVSTFPGGVPSLGVIGAGIRADLVAQQDGFQTFPYREHPVHVLHDSKTSRLLAILLGEIDDREIGYSSLMAFRTAATSGVGFRYLPRKDAETVGLFGSAGQAANQLLALKCERPVSRVKIYSRNPENRRKFAEKYGPLFNLEITPVSSPREAVKGVDVIVCATNTNSVLFDGDWLEPGQHVTGIIGSNVALVKAGFLRYRRREIDDTTAVRADVIVANLRESILSEEQGDLFEPLEKKLIQLEKIHELGELAAKTFPGRTSGEQITYHKNNNGLGCADLAIAMRAYELAKQKRRGTTIDLPTPGTQ